MRRTSSYGAWVSGRAGVVTSTRSSSTLTAQPSWRSRSPITETSTMRGTSVSVVVPSASSEAAISFSTLFFAPGTRT